MYLFNSEKPHQGWVNKICMYVCKQTHLGCRQGTRCFLLLEFANQKINLHFISAGTRTLLLIFYYHFLPIFGSI